MHVSPADPQTAREAMIMIQYIDRLQSQSLSDVRVPFSHAVTILLSHAGRLLCAHCLPRVAVSTVSLEVLLLADFVSWFGKRKLDQHRHGKDVYAIEGGSQV